MLFQYYAISVLLFQCYVIYYNKVLTNNFKNFFVVSYQFHQILYCSETIPVTETPTYTKGPLKKALQMWEKFVV